MRADGVGPLSAAGLDRLRQDVSGSVVAPGDPGYDEARRVWNGMIDKLPGAVVACETAEDVAAVIGVARREGVDLAVRGGGHNVAGYGTCDGGIVIDMGPMNAVGLDRDGMRVGVGGGTRLGDLDRATVPHGVIVPAGVVTDTGVAGLTLGGGLGWVRNKFGVTCDSLLGVEMVTAAGEIVHATKESHPDLLWGLRGGGGNFGVVTRFDFRAYPMNVNVWFSFTWYPADDLVGAVSYFRDFSESAPEEVSTLGAYGNVPATEDFPAETHGVGAFVMAAVYAGEASEGERVTAPLREYARPLADMSGVRPFVEVQQTFDEDYPSGLRYYWKSANLAALDGDVVRIFAEHAPLQPSTLSTSDLWYLGGAIKRVADKDSAFAGRGSSWIINAEANWESAADDHENISWVRSFNEALRPHADTAQYLNFPGFLEGGEDVLRRSFGTKYERLVRLKRTWDPDNVFHLNQNVRP